MTQKKIKELLNQYIIQNKSSPIDIWFGHNRDRFHTNLYIPRISDYL